MGVWMFNVHASGGGDMMRKTIDEVHAVCDRESLNVPLMIGVTVLTSSDANVLHATGIESEPRSELPRGEDLVMDVEEFLRGQRDDS
jgi:orotidine-5'-phosphate decarboxylase